MRIRGDKNHSSQNGNEYLIKKVLEADKFILHNLKIKANTVTLQVTNTSLDQQLRRWVDYKVLCKGLHR